MTKFIKIHEVSRTGQRVRFLAPTSLIRLVCDGTGSIEGTDMKPPAGANAVIGFRCGDYSWVEESVDEIHGLLLAVGEA